MRNLVTLLLALGTTALFGQEQLSQNRILRMATQIQKGILTLPNYGVFDQLSFGFRSSTVFLRGYASRPTLRESAERVAKDVEGVTEVINEIEVLPLSQNDDKIRADVYVAIYGHPSLSRYNPSRGSPYFASLTRMQFGITQNPPMGFHPIHIIVKNGHVRLEGVVDTSGDSVIAEMQANSTHGVFSVENDLVVTNETQEKMTRKKSKKLLHN